MMNNFPPNTDPNIFAFVGAITGAILSSDFSSYELNAIGNWLELVGQYLLTYAAQIWLIESRRGQRNNLNEPHRQEIDFLMEAINKMQNELNNLKNK